MTKLPLANTFLSSLRKHNAAQGFNSTVDAKAAFFQSLCFLCAFKTACCPPGKAGLGGGHTFSLDTHPAAETRFGSSCSGIYAACVGCGSKVKCCFCFILST